MKLLFSFISLIILSSTGIVSAQDTNDGLWYHACEPTASTLQTSITLVDFGTICQSYNDCSLNNGSSECETRVYAEFINKCLEDDLGCRKSVQFYTSLINAYNYEDIDMPYSMLPPNGFDNLQMAIAAYEDRDFGTALFHVQRIYDEYPQYQLLLMIGALYEVSGLSKNALETYDTAVRYERHEPLLYWIRADYHDHAGNSDLAAADYLYLSYLLADNPRLNTTANTLVEKHPFVDARHEVWLKYPDKVHSRWWDQGPSKKIEDLSNNSPIEGKLIFYNNDQNLIVQNFSDLLEWNWSGLPPNALVMLEREEENIYTYIEAGSRYGPTSMRLEFTDNTVMMFEEISRFETYVAIDSLLGRAGETDPRSRIEYLCDGAARVLYSIGDTVQSSDWDPPTYYYETPEDNGESTLYQTTEFAVKIIDGPHCGTGQVWWKIQTNEGNIGWAPEADKEWDYKMLPVIYADCANAPVSRLTEQWKARVNIGGTVNNVREHGGLTSDIIGQIEEGSEVTVLSFAYCRDGIPWVQIETESGLIGYTAEAQGDTYYLEPVVSNTGN